MDEQELVIENLGLATNPSPFAVKPGTLKVAQEMVIDRPGVIETRKGYEIFSKNIYNSSTSTLIDFKNRLYRYVPSAGFEVITYDTTGTGIFSAGDSIKSQAGYMLRNFQQNSSLFLGSTTGVKKIAAIGSTPITAGVPRGLDPTCALNGGANQWFTTNQQVSYRVVWGYVDANGYTIQGAPSGRTVIINGGAPTEVAVTFLVPSGVLAGYFYQVYRSGLSGGVAISPNDELQLVFEGVYAAGTSITIQDNTPPGLAGILLYTNPSQEGIENANFEPPLCKDMTVYKQYAVYANTQRKQFKLLTLLGIGATGISAGNTIKFTLGVSNFTLTGVAGAPAAGQFQVFSTGVANLATDIENTAKSIIQAMNSYASNTILNSWYGSNSGELPGKMFIEARTFSTTVFTIISSAPSTCFNPVVPAAGVTCFSDAEIRLNRIYFSKYGQPEAVPLLPTFDIGSANKAILRVAALRDSLFIFKEDGIFRITGDEVLTFTNRPFDDSVKLLNDNSVAIFDNTIYAYTDSGIVSITDAGVEIISQPIDDFIKPLSNGNYTNFYKSFGVANEINRRYMFFTVNDVGDPAPTIAWVYNSISQQWTTFARSMTAAVEADNNLIYLASWYYFSSGAMFNGPILVSRNAGDYTDYQDETQDAVITGILGNVLTIFPSSFIGLLFFQVVGSKVVLGGEIVDSVTAWNDAFDITVTDGSQFAINNVITIARPIFNVVEYNSLTYGNPAFIKHSSVFKLLIERSEAEDLDLFFTTDMSISNIDKIILRLSTNNGYGDSPYGEFPYGGEGSDEQVVRTYIPMEKARHHWIAPRMENNELYATFALLGLSFIYRTIGEKSRNG